MACGGRLTSLMLTAGSYMLANSGIGNEIGNKIGSIIGDTPILGDITEVIGEVATSIGDWGSEVVNNLTTMGGELFPGIANAIPDELFDDVVSLVAQGALTEMINTVGEETIGVDDIGVFAQHLASGRSFTESTNQFLTSALLDEAIEAVDEYYNPITRAVTGQLAAVNKALPTFGNDLRATGTIINLGNLNTWGNPLSLVASLQQSAGGLAVIEPALLNAGINPSSLSNIIATSGDLNGLAAQPAINVLGTRGLVNVDVESTVEDPLTGGLTTYSTPTLGGLVLGGASTGTPSNKGLGAAVYEALGSVTKSQLSTVQNIFGSNISGLTSMQDMLDPSKLFPNSFPSLTSIAAGGSATQATADAQGLLNPTAKIYTSET
jgi:hypothetical protein